MRSDAVGLRERMGSLDLDSAESRDEAVAENSFASQASPSSYSAVANES